MNLKIVKYSLGKLLIVLAGLLILPLIVAFIYGESFADKINFVIPIIVSLILELFLAKEEIINPTSILKRLCLLLHQLGFCFLR